MRERSYSAVIPRHRLHVGESKGDQMAEGDQGATYRIEQELQVLRQFRASAAGRFSSAVGDFYQLREARKTSAWTLRRLWSDVLKLKAEYECASAAVEAMELHHVDAYLLSDVSDFLAQPAVDRLERHRLKADDARSTAALLAEVLFELRAIRDKAAPPMPDALDIQKARRELNALHR